MDINSNYSDNNEKNLVNNFYEYMQWIKNNNLDFIKMVIEKFENNPQTDDELKILIKKMLK